MSTLKAQAMTKRDVGVFSNVGFNLAPVTLVITYLLA